MAKAEQMLTIVGDKKVANTLLALPSTVFVGVMRGAAGKGIQVIKKQAKVNATPGNVLSKDASGAMKKAIRSRTTANKKKETVSARAFVSRKNKTMVNGKEHNPGAVAHLVEFGHGGSSPAPPHPFMRTALDSKKTEAFQAMNREAKKRLPEAVEKAKKVNKADAIKLLKSTGAKGLLKVR